MTALLLACSPLPITSKAECLLISPRIAQARAIKTFYEQDAVGSFAEFKTKKLIPPPTSFVE
jgi:hypothetical protein